MNDNVSRHGYVLPEINATSLSERSRVDTLSKGFVFRYMLATLGLFAGLMTPVTMSLAIRVSELVPADKNATLGWILGLGALFATLANPIAGMLSDRLRSRFGRRPLLIGGVPGAVGCSLVIGASTSISVITMAWCLTQLFSNAFIVISGVVYALGVLLNPQTAAPIFGPLFLAINSVAQQNYDALFMAAAVFAIAGSFTVLFVRGAG